jgi:homogentisate 1,2-dioxygenase
MPFYHKLGKIPEKKHITFFKEDGISLYREELCSTKGFSGIYSTKYHIHLPTSTLKVEELSRLPDNYWNEAPLSYYHFLTDKLSTEGDFFTSRNQFLRNNQQHTLQIIQITFLETLLLMSLYLFIMEMEEF